VVASPTWIFHTTEVAPPCEKSTETLVTTNTDPAGTEKAVVEASLMTRVSKKYRFEKPPQPPMGDEASFTVTRSLGLIGPRTPPRAVPAAPTAAITASPPIV